MEKPWHCLSLSHTETRGSIRCPVLPPSSFFPLRQSLSHKIEIGCLSPLTRALRLQEYAQPCLVVCVEWGQIKGMAWSGGGGI